MTVEATPFVVEKLIASVCGVHGRVCARSAYPVERSTTVSPRTLTVRAPPPLRRPTMRWNARRTGSNPGETWPEVGIAGQAIRQRDRQPAQIFSMGPMTPRPGLCRVDRVRARDALDHNSKETTT